MSSSRERWGQSNEYCRQQMLFSSWEYIFIFLPLVFCMHYCLAANAPWKAAKAFLVLGSLVYYAWWNVSFLSVILFSVLFNYAMAGLIRSRRAHGKPLLILGIAGNLAVLGYFKYYGFFVENVNTVFGAGLWNREILLPLGISFFTFQQIAFLVDCFKEPVRRYGFLDYSLFVTFFPQLIAGPIVHHKEMLPQFEAAGNRKMNHDNIVRGIFLFSIGLAKKVLLADNFAALATAGFDGAQSLTIVEAWAVSLSYTFQLYFDFSGYTDMALGSALLFNIRLPVNFDSPYRALSIQDFWRRWHMTLSRFLRDYVYLPLGGSRNGTVRTCINLMATFLLAGLWHGAGWTFVFWGALHGAALAAHRIWRALGLRMWTWLAWGMTFLFVNFAWIFFRARQWEDARKILQGMAGLGRPLEWGQGAKSVGHWLEAVGGSGQSIALLLFALLTIFCKNSNALLDDSRPLTRRHSVCFASMAAASLILMTCSDYTEFIYFNF